MASKRKTGSYIGPVSSTDPNAWRAQWDKRNGWNSKPDPKYDRVITSESDPFPTSLVPTQTLGKLYACYLPGKKGSGFSTPGTWKRDMAADFKRLKEVYAVDLILCLIEAQEFDSLGAADYFVQAAAFGVLPLWCPIRDMAAPVGGAAPFAYTVLQVASALQQGKNVAVHCRGGHGRTGLAVACILHTLGEGTAAACIDRIRTAHDKRCVQTWSQESFIYRFCGEEKPARVEPERPSSRMQSSYHLGSSARLGVSACWPCDGTGFTKAGNQCRACKGTGLLDT